MRIKFVVPPEKIMVGNQVKFTNEHNITLQLICTSKILCIHNVALYCRIHSQRYDIFWKYGDKARIAPIIDSDLARP